MKLFGRSSTNFIGTYPNALTKRECEILINQFEKSPQYRGVTLKEQKDGMQVPVEDPSVKKCMQLANKHLTDGSVITTIIKPALEKGCNAYYKKHPALFHTSKWGLDSHYSFQKYVTEEDGYKSWHCEQCVASPRRVGAWMFYLNNAKSGTEFMDHPNIQGRAGSLYIWPAFWTHMHRGAPNKGLKYIITGWLCFSNSKQLDYGSGQSIIKD